MNAISKNSHGLLASQRLFEKLCECNEHREFGEFEVRSCEREKAKQNKEKIGGDLAEPFGNDDSQKRRNISAIFERKKR